jgi:Ribonuclease G/E
MEISRQRIGQSIYETFYHKCECCNGNGLKKTKSIVIHNLISLIKNLNSLDENETYEIRIDDQFFKDNETEINKRIKSLKLTFEVKFIKVEKDLEFNTFEIDQKILEKINIKSKENIEKHTVEEKSEKSYRRKIKKKSTEDIS